MKGFYLLFGPEMFPGKIAMPGEKEGDAVEEKL